MGETLWIAVYHFRQLSKTDTKVLTRLYKNNDIVLSSPPVSSLLLTAKFRGPPPPPTFVGRADYDISYE